MYVPYWVVSNTLHEYNRFTTSLTFKWRWCMRRKMRRRRRRRTNWVRFLLSDAILIWLSLTAKFLSKEEEEHNEDWHRPMSPWPSDVNDEATKLCASATARRAAHSPMLKVPESIPWHFLLPTQGNPDIWAVHVKVWCINHELYEGLCIVAWLWRSPHLSTCPLLHPSQRWYLSLTHSHVSIFPPWDSGICVHWRLTMWCHRCCPQLGNCILMVITGPPGRMLDFTFHLYNPLHHNILKGEWVHCRWVIPWWHWPHLWAW